MRKFLTCGVCLAALLFGQVPAWAGDNQPAPTHAAPSHQKINFFTADNDLGMVVGFNAAAYLGEVIAAKAFNAGPYATDLHRSYAFVPVGDETSPSTGFLPCSQAAQEFKSVAARAKQDEIPAVKRNSTDTDALIQVVDTSALGVSNLAESDRKTRDLFRDEPSAQLLSGGGCGLAKP